MWAATHVAAPWGSHHGQKRPVQSKAGAGGQLWELSAAFMSGVVHYLLSSVKAWEMVAPKGDNATYLCDHLSDGFCVRAALSNAADSWATQPARHFSWAGVDMLCPSSHMRASLDPCLPVHAGQPGLQAQTPTTQVQALLGPPVRPRAPQSWPGWPTCHCPEVSCSHLGFEPALWSHLLLPLLPCLLCVSPAAHPVACACRSTRMLLWQS